MKHLSAINEYLTNLFKKTDDLEKLEKKVNEMIVDEIIRDFTLHRAYKELKDNYIIYEVKEDDFNHIIDYIKPIQDIILPDIVIIAQRTNEDFKILFRVNHNQTHTNIGTYFERKLK